MRKVILLLLILFFCSYRVFCQAPDSGQLTRDLDSLINSRLDRIAPGCAVLVAKKGKVVYEKGFGSANLELNVAMRPDMIFRLGSVTKQYTAIAILQLVEQKKISLQDSIQKFIKDFPSKGKTITIENLLTHTSGIIDYQSLNTKYANENFYFRKDYKPSQVIDFFKNEPLAFPPGSKFAYSNSNYFLLGYIIEKVSGESYKDYMQKNIFNAAGLTHTYYGGYKEIVPNRVSGYTSYNGKYENADYVSMSIPYAAGALMSNVEDMYKWHEALYAYKLVKKETLEKAFKPYLLTDGTYSNYGYGWFMKDLQGVKTIEHSGGIDGFQSDEVYMPGDDTFVVALFNLLKEGGDDISFIYLSNDIATLAIGKPIIKELKIDNSILKQYTGIYAQDSKHTATVTLDNGHLQIESRSGGLPKSPLFAQSENMFKLRVVKAEVEFVKDSSGIVTKLIVHVNGQQQICNKIK